MIKKFNDFVNEGKNYEIARLYNAINNDASVKRYTTQAKDVMTAIEKKLKKIPFDSEIQFQRSVVLDAISASKGKLKTQLEQFAAEMDINIQTLIDKETNDKK